MCRPARAHYSLEHVDGLPHMLAARKSDAPRGAHDQVYRELVRLVGGGQRWQHAQLLMRAAGGLALLRLRLLRQLLGTKLTAGGTQAWAHHIDKPCAGGTAAPPHLVTAACGAMGPYLTRRSISAVHCWWGKGAPGEQWQWHMGCTEQWQWHAGTVTWVSHSMQWQWHGLQWHAVTVTWVAKSSDSDMQGQWHGLQQSSDIPFWPGTKREGQVQKEREAADGAQEESKAYKMKGTVVP